MTVLHSLAEALRVAPGRPFVTMYDDRTGDRVELSVVTLDNWVCKLANLLTSDRGLEPGDVLHVDMPAHWQAMVTLLAAWTAGLTVSFAPVPGAAAITGWEDVAAEVLAQPDLLMLPANPTNEDPALVGDDGTATHGDLVARGQAAARALGLTGTAGQGRLLTNRNPADLTGLDIALLGPLVTSSPVVLLLGATAARRDRVAQQERTTTSSWE